MCVCLCTVIYVYKYLKGTAMDAGVGYGEHF